MLYGFQDFMGRVVRVIASQQVNQVWAYDFVHDGCANGQKLKLLTVVDEWTRECLAIEVGSRINSSRVIEVLARLMSLHGHPTYLRSGNGPEFEAHESERLAHAEWGANEFHRAGQTMAEWNKRKF